jgi:hypothetical protein
MKTAIVKNVQRLAEAALKNAGKWQHKMAVIIY